MRTHMAEMARKFTEAIVVAGTLLGAPLGATTLLVYNNNDTGPGSLRQVMSDNNGLGGGNTILFSNVSGIINVTHGELLISTSVTLVGPGNSVLTLDGNYSNRLFHITGGSANISGLRMVHGKTNDGAGILLAAGASLGLGNCTLSGNIATATGGAVSTAGSLSALNCTFSGNFCQPPSQVVPSGAAIYESAGQATLQNCTISQNVVFGSGSGGAVMVAALSSATFNTCTLCANTNTVYGGAFFCSGTLQLYSCTIASNSASQGGGIYHDVNGSVQLFNTILAGNTANNFEHTATPGPDCKGTVTSFGYNLVGQSDGSSGWGAVGDLVGTTSAPFNAGLGPLQDNGGPTLTMEPLAGSIVIDQGASGGFVFDQRGRPRPHDNPAIANATNGDGSDIGAVEVGGLTLIVTNTNDSGAGSLRQAIADAFGQEGDTVTFASNVVGSITLTSGELPIEKSLKIIGPGASVLAVSGNHAARVFDVLSGNVSISGLTIKDGQAIGSSGSVEQSGGDGRGGGIFNQSTLGLSGCLIMSNSVLGGLGGPTDSGSAGNGGRGLGGGVYNIGNMTISDCLLSYNSGTGGQGGQAGSGFAGGAGNGLGGGICSLAATLSLTRCSLGGNSASGGPGGTATNGGSDGNGGQGYGGGLYSESTVNVTNCSVTSSSAIAGLGNGGIGSGSGGGIYNALTLGLFTCTVASNTASGSSFDFGGGIYDNGTALTIRNCTIAGNRATFGGGLFTGTADLGNTILAANTNGPGGSGPDGSGTIFSSDFNLVQATNGLSITGTITHNILNQNPLLGPLRDNGGPGPTMALAGNSPAIDKGKGFGFTTDERGRPRPFDFPAFVNADSGDGSDIGAFELNPAILNVARAGTNVLVSWSSHDGGYTLQIKTNLGPSFTWSTEPVTPVIVADQYIVTNNPVGNKFYRLTNP